jgi:uncharacterized protein YegL
VEEQIVMPDVELPKRPLHFFWVVDTSGSMAENGKIGIANNVIQECVPEMRKIAKENPFTQLFMRTLRFSFGASWVEDEPVKIDEFVWSDLNAGGVTDLGEAFEMLAAQFTAPLMPEIAFPPVVVLLSDGRPTTDSYKKPLYDLLKSSWGKSAVKIAIAIGKEAHGEEAKKVFFEFTGNKELILAAHDAVEMSKWVFKEVTKAISMSSDGIINADSISLLDDAIEFYDDVESADVF